MSRRNNFCLVCLLNICPLSPPPGLVSHSDLDDRAIEALKEFNEEGALQVLLQFKDSDLSHVQVCARHANAVWSRPSSSIVPACTDARFERLRHKRTDGFHRHCYYRVLNVFVFFAFRTKVPFFVALWRRTDRERNKGPKWQTPIKDQMKPKSK